jgi:uncharacterized cupredoxin-like copper-binding protein
MYKSFKRALFASGILTLTLALVGCGDSTSASTTTGIEDSGSDTTGMGDIESEFSFGQPADSANADRTVEIIASDDLTFDPAEIAVSPGEVITFRVINDGQITHDFVLGDEAAQDEHEEEMAEMEGMVHDEPNTVSLEAGETKELTWRFGEGGALIFGCHEPGHYDGGMLGHVTVDQ